MCVNDDPEKCPICGTSFLETGFVFFDVGASLVDKRGDTVCRKSLFAESYLTIGFHGNENFSPGSQKAETYCIIEIVDSLDGAEFCFCSIECTKIWFHRILEKLSSDILIQKKRNENKTENDVPLEPV
jgi:hypothetical protein